MTPALTVRFFFCFVLFFLPLVPPGLCIDLPISTRLCEKKTFFNSNVAIQKNDFLLLFESGDQTWMSVLMLGNSKILNHCLPPPLRGKAQQVESAGQCTSRRKCLKRFLWCSSQFGGESGVIASGYWDRVSVLIVINRIALWREGLL